MSIKKNDIYKCSSTRLMMSNLNLGHRFSSYFVKIVGGLKRSSSFEIVSVNRTILAYSKEKSIKVLYVKSCIMMSNNGTMGIDKAMRI